MTPCVTVYLTPTLCRSIRHAFQTILKEEGGFWSLYRGIFPTLTGIAPYVGLNFACYETLKGMKHFTQLFISTVSLGINIAA